MSSIKSFKHYINEEIDYRAPKHILDLHNNLSSVQDEFEDHHLDTIKKYTDHSVHLNRAMRKRASGESTQKHPLEDDMHEVTNVHKLHKDITVHTGANPPEHILNHPDYKSGKGVSFNKPDFMSTSIDEKRAMDFSKKSRLADSPFKKDGKNPSHILSLKVKKGTHAAYVAPHSKHEDEYETVLPPGKIHITHHTEEDHPKFGHRVVWHGEYKENKHE